MMIWACAAMALFSAAMAADGVMIELIAYVEHSILDGDGDVLADGSIVMIFGSTDNINDGPQSWGDSLIADSTQGDDVFLGWVRIGDPSYDPGTGPVPGTFYTAGNIFFDDEVIFYFYIRFFDTNAYPVEGSNVPWGTSLMYEANILFNKGTVIFGENAVSATNNFVIIPEPGTAHLLLLFVGLVAGMHSSFRKSRLQANGSKTGCGRVSGKSKWPLCKI